MAQQAPLSIGLSRQEYWSRLLFPFPGDLPEPGIPPGSPALQADSLPTEVSAKPKSSVLCVNLKLHLRAGNRDLGNNGFSERGVHFSLWAAQGAPRPCHAISTSAFCPATRPKRPPLARSPHGPWWLPELLLGRGREQGMAQRAPSKSVGAPHGAAPQNPPLAQRLPHASDGPPHLPRRLRVGWSLSHADSL